MASPSPSKKSVSSIKSKLLNPALTSHFQCWFNPPDNVRNWLRERNRAGVGIPYDGNEEFFSLLCSEASLPGSSLATVETNNDFTGVTERHAYRRIYDDRADFTFYVDHDHNVIKFFENWISYIVNEQFTDQNGRPNNAIELPNYSYRVNYPNLYRTEVYLNKFERDYNGRYTRYRFLQAYPISITSMPVSYDSSNLLKCTVSFTYTRYLITGELNEEDPNTSYESLTPEQQAALNTSSNNLFGTGALATSVPGLNIGGASISSSNRSGNTVRQSVSQIREMRLRTQNRIAAQGGVPATGILQGPPAPTT